jgi:hypothetical protein
LYGKILREVGNGCILQVELIRQAAEMRGVTLEGLTLSMNAVTKSMKISSMNIRWLFSSTLDGIFNKNKFGHSWARDIKLARFC